MMAPSRSPLVVLVTVFVALAQPLTTLALNEHGTAKSATNELLRRAQVSSTPAPPKVGTVTKLRLMNADTDQPIPAYDPLPVVAVVDLSTLSTKNLNIEAVTATADGELVRSVQWKVNGAVRTENNARWALCGNSGANFFACGADVLAVGTSTPITVTATPFADSNANGAPGGSVSIALSIVTGVKPPTKAPVVVKPPTKAPVVVKPPTKAPVVVKPPTKAPVVVKLPTKAPVVVIVPTKAPVAVKPPTKVPVAVKPPTKAPIVMMPPTKAPVVVKPPTKAPMASTIAPTQAPYPVALFLVNAVTDLFIGKLSNDTVIDVSEDETREINLFFDIDISKVGSVQFKTNGVVTRTDNAYPFSYKGNTGYDFDSWTPAVGRYTVTATAYAKTSAAGPIVSTMTVTFVVVTKQGEVIPPTLLGCTIPDILADIAVGPASVVVMLKARDNESGLKQVVVETAAPTKATYIVPSGDTAPGKVVEFNMTLIFPQETFIGEYSITVRLTDMNNNTRTYRPGDLFTLGFDYYFDVRREVKLLNFVATSPTEIQVSNQPVQVSFNVTVQSAGLDWINLIAQGGSNYIDVDAFFDRLVGVHTVPIVVEFPPDAAPATCTLTLRVNDVFINKVWLDADELKERGFPSTIVVTRPL